MDKKIVIIGAGVAGINAATKLVDNGYPGELITIIDKGNDPINRLPEEVMTGMLGAGGWSDGKLVVSTSQGGQLSKYCGEDKAIELMDEVVENFRRFHPKPEEIFLSDPKEEPEFIKPQFTLRMSPVWHIGSNFLHEIAKAWYTYLLDKGVKFKWNEVVEQIDFKNNTIHSYWNHPEAVEIKYTEYNKLIFAVGKSGIDFAQQLSDQYKLPTEAKAVQIGVRFEAPQKYFQKLIDVSYDFKLYQKHDNVSIRSFCTNNNKGLYYSPLRTPSKTSEGNEVTSYQIEFLDGVRKIMGGYFDYIDNFISDMNKIFEFGDDWGMYIPEVKYLSPEPLVNYNDLSLNEYPNVHFVGDALSARGITVSGAHGIYVAESLVK